MTQTVVIAGAGHAAGQAVATLKQKRFAGRIILVGEEPYLPYQRPPLSKKYLAGEMPAERLLFKPESFYDDERIELRLNTRIEQLDRAAHRLITADGDSIAYDKLILALGARVRTVPGATLDGIYTLRGIDDVDRIRAEIVPGHSVVIVGAGYIGLEVAAVCRQLELNVTVIEIADRVLSRVVSPRVSGFYEQYHRQHGVDLRLATGLVGFEGDGRLSAVAASDGRTIDTDFAVIGIGVMPNTEIADTAGLPVDNGIVVDDKCQTQDEDIYAIGDCTSHPNSIYNRRLRLESVHNALEQAKTAASNICGEDVRYSQVPWFWSDQYDLKLQIAGLSDGYDEAILRGDPADARFACFYMKQGRLIAVDAINSPREFMQSKPLIANRAHVDPAKLANAAIAIRDLS